MGSVGGRQRFERLGNSGLNTKIRKIRPEAKILKAVRATIERYSLLEKNDKVLIAYSGGIDSTALLAVFLKLRLEWSLSLALAHFNHKLRAAADEDLLFVRQAAQKHTLPLYVGSQDVRSYAREHRLNLEEAARNLRYDFLRETARKTKATKIATGHTLTDQAETFFMRLLRGSGVSGLAGIFPVVEGLIIRPLVQVEREDIEAFLRTKGLEYRVDESNFDRRFLRNKIRLDLLPYLQKNFEVNVISQVGKAVAILQAEDASMDRLAKAEAQKAVLQSGNRIELDLGALSSLPRGLARRVVRHFILKVKGDLRRISFEDVESLLSLGKGKDWHLKKDLVLHREQDRIFLKDEAAAVRPYELAWDGKDVLIIPEAGLKFKGMEMEKTGRFSPEFDNSTGAFLDRFKLEFPLAVRSRREGDRYQPLGSPGRNKLKEIMRAKGIPQSLRSTLPVFLSGDEIVWVYGLPVAEKFKVTENTEEIFLIRKM